MSKVLHLLLACAAFAAWALFLHRHELSARDAVYDDNGYYYVLHGAADPAALEGDLLMAAYRRGDGGAGFAWKWPMNPVLARAEAALLDKLPLRKVLVWKSVIFQVLAGIPVFLLGLAYFGAGGGYFFAAVFYAYFSSMDVFFGGLPRGAHVCLVGLAFYFLKARSLPGLLAYAALTYFLYVSALPLALALLGIFLFLHTAGRARAAVFAGAAVAVAGLFSYVFFFHPETREMLRAAFAWKSTFNVGAGPAALRLLLGFNDHGGLYMIFTALLLLGTGLLYYGENSFEWPREARIFGAAMTAAFLGAALVDVNLASRQLLHALPLLLAVLFCFNFYRRPSLRGKPAAALAAAALLLFVLAEKRFLTLDAEPKEHLYRLAALPADSLVFSHPHTARLIGLYAARSVYSHDQWEDLLCGFGYKEGCAEAARRFRSSIAAYYAADISGLRELAAAGKVTHILADIRLYDEEYLDRRVGNLRAAAASKQALAAAGRPAALKLLAQRAGERISEHYYLLEAGALSGKAGAVAVKKARK
ncbi:MAG: hypothetical protein NDI60_04485 [Elusimicrobiales bacterium]|nr:hypothetical protein [Elusimicrobiales bacterium]